MTSHTVCEVILFLEALLIATVMAKRDPKISLNECYFFTSVLLLLVLSLLMLSLSMPT